MPYDKFLIAPFESGLDKSQPVWLTPEDSLQRLNNAYIWRGRVRKRFGSRYMGENSLETRFRINLGNTGSGENPPGELTATVPGHIWKIGQAFSIGSNIYTVYQIAGNMLKTGGNAATYTYDTNNGNVVFTGEDNDIPVYFYPAEPVMGLDNWENGPINDHPAFGWDTQFAYKFTGNAWDLASAAPPTPDFTLHSSNSQFVWSYNWQSTADFSLLFMSNFNTKIGAVNTNDLNDAMYYWNGTVWTEFKPIFTLTGYPPAFNIIGPNAFIKTAKIIIPFQGRLLLLNTIENGNIIPTPPGTEPIHGTTYAYPNRCRFSWDGDPTDPTAFLEEDEIGYGGAGWIDAGTEEAIIGAEFIKNHLIVYFERSTWELAYTGSKSQPFIWQKLNSELGTQSTFSMVIFDKVVLSVANAGICACNGSNVERVDDKIPQDIFNIRTTNEGIARVAGIRDYQNEVVYWSWPIKTQPTYSSTYPSKILVYNYKNGTWAYNDDVITAWGYFEQDTGDIWAGDTQRWEDDNSTWASGVEAAEMKRIIAGNQQGYTFIVEADLTANAQVMQVTNAVNAGTIFTLTLVDHTLSIGDFISLQNMNGLIIIDNTTEEAATIFKINSLSDKDIVTIDSTNYTITGTYTGGGTAARVSKIDIVSKQWNPYIKDGNNFHLAKMDFCVVKTDFGEITVDYSPNSATEADGNGVSMIDASVATNSGLGTSILETKPFTLYPLENTQLRLWHPVYFGTQGDCIQIRLYFSDAEMVNPEISQTAKFILEGIMLFTHPTSSRIE